MVKFINKLKNRKGFTLIELIVVLAVLAIIAAIAIPRFLGVQEEAKENADDSTLTMIASAAELYFAQNATATSAQISDLDISDVSFKAKKNASYAPSSFVIKRDDDGKISVFKDNTSSAAIYVK